jgi:hypothetical protein
MKVIYYIVCIIIILFIWLRKENIEKFEKYEIPKIIWSFWDNPELPEIIKDCKRNWKKFAPNYNIKFLNKNNIENYVDMPINWKNLPVYRQSDVLRLKLLEKYGGIWMDASILLFENPDNFVGGDITLFTSPLTNQDDPIYENWFIASTKGNILIKTWINEVLYAIKNEDEYVASCSDYNIDLLNYYTPTYLICHLALRNIYDQHKDLFKNGLYYDSITTAFYEHNKYNWEDVGRNAFQNFSIHPERLMIKFIKNDRADDFKIPSILL